MGVVSPIPLYEESLSDSGGEKGSQEREIIDISISGPIRSSSGNGGGCHLVYFCGILEYLAGSARIASRCKYIAEQVQLACLFGGGDRCIIRELCAGRSDIDIIPIPENIGTFSGKGDDIAPFRFGFDDMSECSIILIGGDIAVGGALFLRRVMIPGVLGCSDAIDDT